MTIRAAPMNRHSRSKAYPAALLRVAASSLSKHFSFNRLFAANLFRYLRFVWESGPRWTLASAVLVALLGALPLATLYLIKLAVEAVEGTLGYDTILGFNALAVLIALLGLATLLEALCGSADRIISLIQGNALTDRMFDLLHAKSTEVDLEYYENAQYHDTLHRAQQEAPVRPVRVLDNLRLLAQHGISLLAIGGLLIWLHWGVVVVLLAAAIPGALVRMNYARKAHAWERQITPRERRASYFNWLLTRDACAKEIRLFSLGSFFKDRFRRLRSQIRREKVRLASRKTLAEMIAMGGAICVSFAMLGYLAMRTVHGLMSLGDLVMFYAAVQRGQILLRQVFNNVADLYEDNLFLANLYDFLGLKTKLKEPAHPQPLNRRMQSGIVFDRVSFQYPGDEKRVLDQVTLAIQPGEHVALVGENGAGKSTLTKLLCRLYDPTEGIITLDGVDLRDYATRDLRRNISVVFQDYGRYQLTARENIWLGNIDLPADDRRLEPAVKKAGVDPVIAKLANGYDTLLGNWFEGGQELSAGEWQKIALARAFLHDGEIIVLDEPGSALDARAEHEIFERFHQLVKGKTAILISHRLSTVKMADRIYVLKQGRIVESGSHEELIKASGTYAWMFETQAQRYR
jgi:ATP-binding cassette, subfamily B, bacterial